MYVRGKGGTEQATNITLTDILNINVFWRQILNWKFGQREIGKRTTWTDERKRFYSERMK